MAVRWDKRLRAKYPKPLRIAPLMKIDNILICICQQCDPPELLAMHLVSSRNRSFAAVSLYRSIEIVNKKQIFPLQRTLVANRRLCQLVHRVAVLPCVTPLEIEFYTESGVHYPDIYGHDLDVFRPLVRILLAIPNLPEISFEKVSNRLSNVMA